MVTAAATVLTTTSASPGSYTPSMAGHLGFSGGAAYGGSRATRAALPKACVFFHAADGIRDRTVTGVQTCALPICRRRVLVMGASGCTAAHRAIPDPERPREWLDGLLYNLTHP